MSSNESGSRWGVQHPYIDRTDSDDLLRLAGSIRDGKVSSSLVVAKLAAYPQHSELALALRELGRIERTLFTLEASEAGTPPPSSDRFQQGRASEFVGKGAALLPAGCHRRPGPGRTTAQGQWSQLCHSGHQPMEHGLRSKGHSCFGGSRQSSTRRGGTPPVPAGMGAHHFYRLILLAKARQQHQCASSITQL